MFELINLIKATNIKPYLRSFHFFACYQQRHMTSSHLLRK